MALLLSAFWAMMLPCHIDRPELWAAVANSSWTNEPVRRNCAHRLFHHYVRAGMKVSRLAELLNNPNWISDSDISALGDGTRYSFFEGYSPVELRLEDTVFIILRIPAQEEGTESVWFRIDGTMSRERFIEFLRCKLISPKEDTTILEVGFGWGKFRGFIF
jgi:hypothetical protein